MNQEVLIPKMRRSDKGMTKFGIPWANIVVVIFSILLIFMSAFINLNIRHYILPAGLFSDKQFSYDDFIYVFNLIPQVPVIIFICSVLGKKLALTSVCLYILAGLFVFPVFALGGGIRYIFEYGFGYILAYIPAVVVSGNCLERKYTFFSMIKAALAGVLTIHILGIIYMFFIALLRHSGWEFMSGWIVCQSGLKILYDLILSFILVLIGRYLHNGLKFILE